VVAKEITLVRHGETTANAAGVWQGSTNSLLSDRGQQQAAEAGARLKEEAFDVVIASDLGRTQQTATAIGFEYELDPRWRELQLGAWEGMTRAEIIATYPEEAVAFWTGQEMSIDGSETIGELTLRVGEALESIEARLPDGGRALVVTHGGPIFGIVAEILGISSPPPLSGVANTSLTRLALNDAHREVAVYNDFGHLAERAGDPEGATQIVLIRHGQTRANLQHRWQGQSDWGLTDDGVRQAELLAAELEGIDAVYSSPLSRARITAGKVAEQGDLEVAEDEALQEIGFGTWESKTVEEILEIDPEGFARLRSGEDFRRGTTGETFTEVADRMERAVARIVEAHPGERVAVVSHGGATRAFATRVLGMDFAQRHRLPILGNTALGRIDYSDRGRVVAKWNVAPHLAG
jgi:broad specificity phosphatase PhoE